MQKQEKNGKNSSRFSISDGGDFLSDISMANLKKSLNCVHIRQYSFSAIYVHNSNVVHVVFLEEYERTAKLRGWRVLSFVAEKEYCLIRAQYWGFFEGCHSVFC